MPLCGACGPSTDHRRADTAIGTADAPREENAAVEAHKQWPSEDSSYLAAAWDPRTHKEYQQAR